MSSSVDIGVVLATLLTFAVMLRGDPMNEYEDLILMYQDWESEYDECTECEYGTPESCEDQCMMIHESKWKIEQVY